MPDVYSDVKTRQQPADLSSASALSPIPPAALAWRRRAIRLSWLMTFVGGLGLSALPGPKGSSDTVTYSEDGGRKVAIHKFTYIRNYGVPFHVARVDLDDAGNMKNFTIKGDSGLFGNFAVAFAISVGLLMLWGRRRRDT
jgi:hypothetical protein